MKKPLNTPTYPSDYHFDRSEPGKYSRPKRIRNSVTAHRRVVQAIIEKGGFESKLLSAIQAAGAEGLELHQITHPERLGIPRDVLSKLLNMEVLSAHSENGAVRIKMYGSVNMDDNYVHLPQTA